MVRLLHEATGGRDDARALHPRACERIREELYLLVALRPGELRTRHPEAARHLSRCVACRDRFATLLLVEQDVASDAAQTAPSRAAEAQGRPALVGVVRDLVAPLVVSVGKRVAAFVRIPDGVVGTGLVAAPMPVRGEGGADEVHGLRTIEIAVGGDAIRARLVVELQGPGLVAIEVALLGGSAAGGTVALRVAEPALALVALATIPADDSVKLHGVPCGRYLLEIRAGSPPEVVQAPLEIEPFG
jgi:hypothetical protein